jgi:hypothetical protein
MKVALTGATRHIGSHVLTELQAHGHVMDPAGRNRVGIIGAGRLGQAMARTALRAGRSVVIANSRGPGIGSRHRRHRGALGPRPGGRPETGMERSDRDRRDERLRPSDLDGRTSSERIAGLVGGEIRQLRGPLAGINLIRLP